MTSWFEVDKKGLAQLLERRGQSFVVTELLQNAWDENVTDVELRFSKRASDGRWVITVTDDSPEGFSDLTDAFTLFKASKKKGDAEKRGRFNLGEKLVLALASEATVTTTSGQVVFDAVGRVVNKRKKRPSGTCFQGVFPTFKNKDVDEALVLVRRLIPPSNVNTIVYLSPRQRVCDDDVVFKLQHRSPIRTFITSLPTEVADDDGVLKRTQRKTTVEVYEADGDFRPAIYELGIPVVDTDDKYVVNVLQKVPLNLERDNVTPAYLRTLRTAVTNETADLLKGEDVTSTWVGEALADERIEPEVVTAIIKERYGDKVVAYDPSDPEANKIAAAQGYTVLHGRTFSKDQWANVRDAGAVQAAGRVTPSAKVLTSPDGIPPLDRDAWDEAHHLISEYACRFHKAVGLGNLIVDFQHKRTQGNGAHAAWYSFGHLTINISRLGVGWLSNVPQVTLDALLIHEFGHYYSSDHLSSKYYDALCEIGALLRANSDEIGSLR